MLISFLVLFFIYLPRAYCTPANKTQKNVQVFKLVDILKLDLRRDNDDYVDRFNNSKLSPQLAIKQSGAENVPKTNLKVQVPDNVYLNQPNNIILGKDAHRRSVDSSEEINYKKYSFSPVTVTTDSKMFQKIGPDTEYDTQKPLQGKVSTDSNSKHVKSKINKFKKFVNKNRDLIKDFIYTKKSDEVTEPMPKGADADEESTKGNSHVVQRAKSSDEDGEPRARRPDPSQLDMAPAKGGRIHAMRIKGRLCQRSVLMPEGPKYDSKGAAYLAGHSGRRDYARTRVPRLLLPRCCNCCKKSVLGCE